MYGNRSGIVLQSSSERYKKQTLGIIYHLVNISHTFKYKEAYIFTNEHEITFVH